LEELVVDFLDSRLCPADLRCVKQDRLQILVWFKLLGEGMGYMADTIKARRELKGPRMKTLLSLTAVLLAGDSLWAQPNFNFIGVDWFGDVWTVSPTTGSISFIGATGLYGLNALAADNSGKLFAAGSSLVAPPVSDLVTINPMTGHVDSRTLLDFGNRITDVRALAFSQAGTLYAINNGGGFGIAEDELYTVDPSTGRATLVGSTGLDGIQSLDFSPQGVLYGWGLGQTIGVGLVTFNLVTGRATDVNPAVYGTADIQSIVFAPDGNLYGARDALYRINVASEALTLIGSSGADIRGIEVVPEPSLLSLLLSVTLFGAFIRSRQE
jgi:hypothetical protein